MEAEEAVDVAQALVREPFSPIERFGAKDLWLRSEAERCSSHSGTNHRGVRIKVSIISEESMGGWMEIRSNKSS